MRTLHVVTRPQAEHQVEGVGGGRHDSRLTPVGVRAAKAMARSLRTAVPEHAEVDLYSADLQRTKQTAERSRSSSASDRSSTIARGFGAVRTGRVRR